VRLYLIRHPRPAVADGICYGQSDLDLAEPVVEMAALLAPRLPEGLPLYSSPLRRCHALAKALHPSPTLEPRLQEINFGTWEMQPWDAIDRVALDAWAADPLYFQPPGGESPAQLMQRVSGFLNELRTDAILVTHAGVIKAAFACIQKLPATEWMQLSFAFGTLTTLDWQGSAR
jgi:alpha-ribazole phosphatase